MLIAAADNDRTRAIATLDAQDRETVFGKDETEMKSPVWPATAKINKPLPIGEHQTRKTAV
ncbi:hypothetical protein IPU75_16905 [Ochrobactrum sp. SD129]|nr:hypothetical protein [Ochrobactrum sp. SD129]